MNKKNILIIFIIVIILIIVSIIINNKKDDKIAENNVNKSNQEQVTYSLNNETMEYEIYNYKGELVSITKNEDEVDSIVQFYKDNPDYKSEPPSSPNVEIEEY